MKTKDYGVDDLDLVTIRELLEAAAVGDDGLDTKSDLSENSMRYDGIVMLLVFTYNNDYPGFVATGKARYEIKAFRIKNAEFKYEYMVPIDEE